MGTRVGVVGVQGDVPEHTTAMRAAFDDEVTVESVRTAGIVPQCDVVAIPGGESTTISRLLSQTGIDDEIRAHAAAGNPVLATCAGLIICASTVEDDRVESLGLLDVSIDRNAFGRQRESFEAPIDIGLSDPYPGVFIRAPRITDVGDAAVIARLNGEPVAVRQGSVVGASFHPELTADSRFHRRAVGTAQ